MFHNLTKKYMIWEYSNHTADTEDGIFEIMLLLLLHWKFKSKLIDSPHGLSITYDGSRQLLVNLFIGDLFQH